MNVRGSVNRGVERAVAPVGAVLHAARRPTTYAGHVREATSTVAHGGMWPFGFADPGVASVDSVATTTRPSRHPVLLVHGYGANKSNWLFVRRYLAQAGFDRVHALELQPAARRHPDARRASARAGQEALRAHSGTDRIHVVGHSLGGVIARYAVQVDRARRRRRVRHGRLAPRRRAPGPLRVPGRC